MKRAWWREAIVYEIYPRSFLDTDGDGRGDLAGILERVDYLATLGVDVVWITPIYPSPGVDNGYDISDYRAIDPGYGTFEEWQALRDALHARGIRLIMDLVVNHTSDQHPWFRASRASKSNPLRDYYIWRPGRNGHEPNNWGSAFGGSAWTLDPQTGEYYLHIFSPAQPDLNWDNPEVRREIRDIVRWWLDHDIDGFRMDVINLISKVPGFPDAPVRTAGEWQWGGQHFTHGPRLVEYLEELRREALKKDVMVVGEAPGVTTEHALDLAHETGALDMLFHFEHMDLGHRQADLGKWFRSDWPLQELKAVVTRWQTELHGRAWNSFYLSNHDQPRAVSRFGDDRRYRVESAKMLGTLLLTLQATPYIYQGEEIGMTNAPFADISQYRDIETLNFYREFSAGRGYTEEEVLSAIRASSRDNARTPMQWSGEAHAGFTSGTPWIGLNPNYTSVNVERSLRDPDSVFHYYRRLIQLRKNEPTLIYGKYEIIAEHHDQVFAYVRSLGRDRLLVALNFSGETAVFALPGELDCDDCELMIGNYPASDDTLQYQELRPWEARVYRLE